MSRLFISSQPSLVLLEHSASQEVTTSLGSAKENTFGIQQQASLGISSICPTCEPVQDAFATVCNAYAKHRSTLAGTSRQGCAIKHTVVQNQIGGGSCAVVPSCKGIKHRLMVAIQRVHAAAFATT